MGVSLLLGTSLHDQAWGSAYRNPGLLLFWQGEESHGDLSGLGKRKDVAVKLPGVRFMEKEVCNVSPHAEGGWGGGNPQAADGTFL